MNQSSQGTSVVQGKNERLYLTVRMSDTSSLEHYRSAFQKDGFTVTHKPEGACTVLTLASSLSHQLDARLLGLSELLEKLNEIHADKAPAELIETRISCKDSWENIDMDCLPLQRMSEAWVEDSYLEKELGLRLNVGRAFGSGLHPSTCLIIESLTEMFQVGPDLFPQRVLDVGCGTGVLSMVSAKMGAGEVLGIDISAEAVAVAQENITTNKLGQVITITQMEIDELEQPFDLIVANLTPFVLSRMIPKISVVLKFSGILLVSGFRDRQSKDIERQCETNGLTGIKRADKGMWTSMCYRKS